MPFKSPLVVGYKGEIGSFLLHCLLVNMPKALHIWCFDTSETEKEKRVRIKAADIIFLCVPICETIPWLIKYKKILAGKKIVEQCSLKGRFVDHRIESLDIFHMHLLFKPSGTPDPNDRRCVFIEGQFHENPRLVMALCEMTKSKNILFPTLAEHDRSMAIQQTLVHRVILSLNELIMKQPGQTYIGGQVNKLANRIFRMDKDLFNEIQKNGSAELITQAFKGMLNGPIIRS